MNDAGDPTGFLPRYEELLVESGWTYNEAQGKYTHPDTILKIRVANTMFGGISIFNY